MFGDARFLYMHSLRGKLKEVGQVAFVPVLTFELLPNNAILLLKGLFY